MSWEIFEGDCVEAMAAMPEASVDAIVTDPPYGLEFMGKEWDVFRLDDPGTQRNRGERAGAQGGVRGGDPGHPAAGKVAIGGGKRPNTNRCSGCGKRDQFRNPHGCVEGAKWKVEPIDPFGAPPTMLAFQNWSHQWALAAFRVLKPGGHLLAFGGTRTYHRLACAVEDAGFEIRDCLAWLYGSGFPKSLDVSKAIDKATGAEREVVGPSARHVSGKPEQRTMGLNGSSTFAESVGMGANITAPATPEAERWQGWGTALKPAHEPIVMARKPLAGTVAANVLEHGTGALNVDGCRIASPGESHGRPTGKGAFGLINDDGWEPTLERTEGHDAGRWPANVVLDEQAAAMLDEQTEESSSTPRTPSAEHHTGRVTSFQRGSETSPYSDSGGVSRFLYVAKASSAERNAGLDGFASQGVHRYGAGIGEGHDPNAPSLDRNVHPTVKPIELMRWLVRLVTPPDGTVLDPFAGSGTTGCAAVLESLNFVGIEREAEYVAICRARIAWWEQHPEGVELVKALEADRERRAVAESGQLGLLG